MEKDEAIGVQGQVTGMFSELDVWELPGDARLRVWTHEVYFNHRERICQMANGNGFSNCSEIVILVDEGLKNQLVAAATATGGPALASQAEGTGPMFKIKLAAPAQMKMCVSLNPSAIPDGEGEKGDRYVLMLKSAGTCKPVDPGNCTALNKNDHAGD